MKELKFRAWGTKHKHFLSLPTSYVISFDGKVLERQSDSIDNAGYVMEGDYLIEPNVILMQYTGLKDKNGRDIYEGDNLLIVEDVFVEMIGGYPRTEPEGRIEEVKYKDGAFWAGEELLWEEATQGEVISNIYENEG